jgi:RNA polymerase sigma-70 factor (ECF subfamily)
MEPPDRWEDRMSAPQPFASTRWSLIVAAKGRDEPEARRALAELCQLYWFPLYRYIRRRGHSHESAQDLTQEFFARLLEKGGLGQPDPGKGRFRSYLLAACQNFLANQHDRDSAQKRGGGEPVLSLNFQSAEGRYGPEPADARTPEQEFERRWALALLDRALAGLRADYAAARKEHLFDRLKGSLTGEAESYAGAAADLSVSEGAVKVAAHRLRQRFRDRLRAVIAETVESPDEIDDEIRAMFAALA